MDIKRALTFEEQVELLEKKGFIINDKNKVINFLSKNNYYKVSGYFNIFENSEDNVVGNINFEKVMLCYEFDRELMNLLYGIIGEIETYLKTQLANYLSLKYNPLIYENKEIYRNQEIYLEFKNRIDKIKTESKEEIIIHHLKKYDGNIPLWVIIEFLSYGNIYKFCYALKPKYQKELGKVLFDVSKNHLTSWIKTLTLFRNRCAHYNRLYNYKFKIIPSNEKSINYKMDSKLFSQLLVIKYIHSYMDKEKWDNVYKKELFNLIKKYKGIIELEKLGFPKNWEKLL